MKSTIITTLLLVVTCLAQFPATIGKVGPSENPSNTNLPVVFILGDRGVYGEEISNLHHVYLFYENGDMENTTPGGDTLSLAIWYGLSNLPASPRVIVYKDGGVQIAHFEPSLISEIGGINPGDTFLVSWNPDNPATNAQSHVLLNRQAPKLLASPNPFNPSTNICVELSDNVSAVYNIYNVNGILINSFSLDGNGIHHIHWNGKQKDGIPVSSGTYIGILRLKDGKTATNQLLLTK